MKTLGLKGTLVLGIAAGFLTASFADDKKSAADKKPDPKQLQELYKKFATPGKPHQHFKRLVGRWNCEMKMFSPQPSTSKGSATFQVIMGGRYMQQRFRAKMQGQSFQGMGITGYDNAKKKYVGIWVDNMGTGIMSVEGTYDAKKQTLTEIGTSSSPTGTMKMRMTSHYIDKDKFLFTMYLTIPNGERKLMEITYTRAKSKKTKKAKAAN